LSDWTTGDGGLDARNWRLQAPASWPLASPTTLGFGLTGAPDVHRLDYLTANIEGGEKWGQFCTLTYMFCPQHMVCASPQTERISAL